MNENEIAALRIEYAEGTLDEASAASEPFLQFQRWFDQALRAELKEPNAMALATVAEDGHPNCRMVLLKSFSPQGFVFYTNYESVKGIELGHTPWAALVVYWPELERQVRITGPVTQTSDAESDTYFATRPTASRLSAIASPQSQVVPSREWLEERVTETTAQTQSGVTARPKNWGGFRVAPQTVEFWQGRPNRLHDRLRYALALDASWRIERLAP